MLQRILCKRLNSNQLMNMKLKYLDMKNDANFPLEDLSIYTDFINLQEEDSLLKEIDRKLKRLKYEGSHFDKVITGYRETGVSSWSDENAGIFQRMKNCFPLENVGWKPIHVLDLDSKGSIGAHVDYPDYSGDIVSALCLLSSAVIRFRKKDKPDVYADFLTIPRMFYGQRGNLRYQYTHEIISKNSQYEFKSNVYNQERRITLMLRNNLKKPR